MRVLSHVVATLSTVALLIVQAAGLQDNQQLPLLDPTEAQKWSSINDGILREAIFDFDIGWRSGSKNFMIYEHVAFDESTNVTGAVNIVAGDQTQVHDVIVLLQMRSSNATLLDRISIYKDDEKLSIDSNIENTDDTDWIQIIITAFIKPHCLQMGNKVTSIYVQNLDITIWPGLWFETYKMYLTTLQGTITGSESLIFTAHEISIRAINGNIIGSWSLPAQISFWTETGNIDIDLVPKQWSSGPMIRGDTHVYAHKGNVNIRMPFDKDKLSLRNGTTTIQCNFGVINATLIHCGNTEIISTGYSQIDVTILPYLGFYEWMGVQFNHIKTEQFTGTTNLKILSPVIWDYFPINPLCLMRSHHKITNGQLNLSYPKEWCGRAEGNVTRFDGFIKVTGQNYETIVGDSRHVVVQRSQSPRSLLDFEIGGGLASLELRGSDSDSNETEREVPCIFKKMDFEL